MRRKNWISIVCAIAMLAGLALPATAADFGLAGLAGPGFMERVVQWVVGWMPVDGPVEPVESVYAAGKGGKTDPEPPGEGPEGFCEECNGGEVDAGIDPDG